MTDSLRAKLVSILSSVATIHLSEASKDSYPWVVYDMTTAPLLSKDGVEGFRGEAKIRIVGDDFDALDTLRASVESAISTGMHDSTFGSWLISTDKECVEDLWTIELNYTLKQHADWVEPTPEPTEQTESE